MSDTAGSAKLVAVPDNINSPKHYQFEVEVYEIIRILLKGNPNYKEVDAYNIGNVIKYLFRAGLKGEFYEDIGKADWYLSAILNERE